MKEEAASAVRWTRSHFLPPLLTPWGPPVSRAASAVCSVLRNVDQATRKGSSTSAPLIISAPGMGGVGLGHFVFPISHSGERER